MALADTPGSLFRHVVGVLTLQGQNNNNTSPGVAARGATIECAYARTDPGARGPAHSRNLLCNRPARRAV